MPVEKEAPATDATTEVEKVPTSPEKAPPVETPTAEPPKTEAPKAETSSAASEPEIAPLVPGLCQRRLRKKGHPQCQVQPQGGREFCANHSKDARTVAEADAVTCPACSAVVGRQSWEKHLVTAKHKKAIRALTLRAEDAKQEEALTPRKRKAPEEERATARAPVEAPATASKRARVDAPPAVEPAIAESARNSPKSPLCAAMFNF